VPYGVLPGAQLSRGDLAAAVVASLAWPQEIALVQPLCLVLKSLKRPLRQVQTRLRHYWLDE